MDLDKIKKALRYQDMIRIAFDSTPGFGNQAASLYLMNRLRELGFKQTFEIIFSIAAKDKVITLFNLSDELLNAYYDATRKIHFIPLLSHLERVVNNTLTEINFGMTGAIDWKITHADASRNTFLHWQFWQQPTELIVALTTNILTNCLSSMAEKAFYGCRRKTR